MTKEQLAAQKRLAEERKRLEANNHKNSHVLKK